VHFTLQGTQSFLLYYFSFKKNVDDIDIECWNWNGSWNKTYHISIECVVLAHKSQPFWKCFQICISVTHSIVLAHNITIDKSTQNGPSVYA